MRLRRLSIFLASAAFGASMSLSLAQQPIDKKIGHWYLWGASGYCMAYNRPDIEINESPYNALQFLLRKNSDPALVVYFWPKAMPENADVQLAVTLGPVHVLLLPAKSEYGSIARARLSDRLRQDIAQAPDKKIRIKIEGQEYGITVDVADAAAVFAALDDCAKQMLR